MLDIRALFRKYQSSIADFAHMVSRLAQAHDFSITSWIRSVPHNNAVGGKDDSLHQIGLAVDVTPTNDAEKAGIISLARAMGLQVVDEGTLHIEYDHGDAKYEAADAAKAILQPPPAAA